MEQKFIVIGIDDNRKPFFTPQAQTHIRQGRVFSGGIRHQEIVKELLPTNAQWISVTVPLENVFHQYKQIFVETNDPVVVFASGDPLFFGFANTLKREFPEATFQLYPAFNSLQLLAHRLVMPYDDMRTVSLTGRPWQEFDRALIERAPKIGILTDRQHTPAAIATRMIEYGYTDYAMYVGQHLGNCEKEHISCLTLKEAAEATFEHPNNLILKALKVLPPRPFGIPDEQFQPLNGRTRMITKAPIRLLTLQALELNRHRVFWDIGFCTGSVSIEARLQFPHLTVIAFEVRPEGEELMNNNARRFGALGIHAVIGDFLQTDITLYPRPDALFMGGHGGRLPEILAKVKSILHPDGCIVFNAVSTESKAAFCQGVQENKMVLHPSVCIALNDYNPIEIMKATLS